MMKIMSKIRNFKINSILKDNQSINLHHNKMENNKNNNHKIMSNQLLRLGQIVNQVLIGINKIYLQFKIQIHNLKGNQTKIYLNKIKFNNKIIQNMKIKIHHYMKWTPNHILMNKLIPQPHPTYVLKILFNQTTNLSNQVKVQAIF